MAVEQNVVFEKYAQVWRGEGVGRGDISEHRSSKWLQEAYQPSIV